MFFWDIWFKVVCKYQISGCSHLLFYMTKPWWVVVFFSFHSSTIFSAAVWSLSCAWKSLFLEPSRISNSITVRRKIAVKISMLSVVFQSNTKVWGQADLWIVYNRPERPGGSHGHDLTSYLPLWSMVNSFVACLTIIVVNLVWIFKLIVWKTLKVQQFFSCAGQMEQLSNHHLPVNGGIFWLAWWIG